jgi:hypothetical protein
MINSEADFAKSLIFTWLPLSQHIHAETFDGIPNGIWNGRSSDFRKTVRQNQARDGLSF